MHNSREDTYPPARLDGYWRYLEEPEEREEAYIERPMKKGKALMLAEIQSAAITAGKKVVFVDGAPTRGDA